MSLYQQALLDTHDELIVDLFAGGGGASSGIEQALGRMVDVAINHDPRAVALHLANHPQTLHYVSDVFEVDPRAATSGRPVALLWASPDCTFHSKARGAKPIRHATKKRRALAWVVTRWAATAFPRVIMLENVEEFAHWGPLVGNPDELRPCKKRRGQSFRKWVRSLVRLGYTVEWRELRACDYGAPTIRKRFFLIARRDGKPIVWPEPTHGPGLKPYRTAAECIDWTIPMCSVFATKDEAKQWGKDHGQASPIRPLAENTQRRIARGIKKFVLENPRPFLVTIAHGDHGRRGDGTGDINRPLSTITTKNAHAIAASFLAQNNGGFYEGSGHSLEEPVSTILTNSRGHHGLLAAHIQRDFGTSTGSEADSPLGTITTEGGGKAALVGSFLSTFNGTSTGQKLDDPTNTATANDRFGLVTVEVNGQPLVIVDVAMRMLHPRELYRAQGFRDGYIIDRTATGEALTKTEQVRMVGNSVCPPVAEAIVRANCADLIVRQPKRRSA
jgi:DNA (cytosine-5)-methyltransferase 1